MRSDMSAKGIGETLFRKRDRRRTGCRQPARDPASLLLTFDESFAVLSDSNNVNSDRRKYSQTHRNKRVFVSR